jgi:hypothetical protein
MSGIIIIQLIIALLFFILGFAIRKKKAYSLISGFNNRSEDEKQQLIQNGYPQKTGLWLILIAIGMIILLPLSFTSFPFRFEIQFGFLLLSTLSGTIYLSKYELPKKRKRSYIISSTIFIITLGLIITLFTFGEQKSEFILKENSFEITGMYGDEWRYSDIKEIKLLQNMPEITWKQNGFGTDRMAKGRFKVTGYGSSLLFIKKEQVSPVLYLKVGNENIFINGETAEEVKDWYQQLRNKR